MGLVAYLQDPFLLYTDLQFHHLRRKNKALSSLSSMEEVVWGSGVPSDHLEKLKITEAVNAAKGGLVTFY